jgi:hypothetical protein
MRWQGFGERQREKNSSTSSVEMVAISAALPDPLAGLA